MSEHTSGPWEAREYYTGCLASVHAGDYRIADMVLPPGGIPTNDANARLIAAAPDLLAALEAMRDAIIPTEDRYAAILADAAIAKAKGERGSDEDTLG